MSLSSSLMGSSGVDKDNMSPNYLKFPPIPKEETYFPIWKIKVEAQVRGSGMIEILENEEKEIQEKMSALVKQRVSTLDSIPATESLSVAVHILNSNPGDIRNLPVLIVFSSKKQSSDPVTPQEF